MMIMALGSKLNSAGGHFGREWPRIFSLQESQYKDKIHLKRKTSKIKRRNER